MIAEPKEQLRHTMQPLLEALRNAGAEASKPKAIRCPFHDDAHASGGVYEDETGVWRFKCHAASCGYNGDVFDVRERATGQTVADQLRELKEQNEVPVRKPKHRHPSLEAIVASVKHVSAVYGYTNPDTKKLDLVVIRSDPPGERKQFIQARPDGDGFVKEAPPKPWPLYNRIRLETAKDVLVVEGEKCVHAAQAAGVVATTNPCGAGKAGYADWHPLAGKRVYLWPDNDPPGPNGLSGGIEHMREVARILQDLDPMPQLLRVDPQQFGLPPKGDVVDYLDQFGTSVEDRALALKAALAYAEPMGASGELSELFDEIISGKRFAVRWPWKAVTNLTKALMPGTVTCVCGDPGATKSFFLLEAASYWHRFGNDGTTGIKVALFELEEDRVYHMNRLLAQLAENSELTDDVWVKNNEPLARRALEEHQAFLDEFGRSVYAAPDRQPSLKDLEAWVRQMASAGCRVIAIDPITAAGVSDKPWIDDLKFLMAVKTIMRQHGASLVLVTHPRKGKRISASLHDLAGGAAYQRFSQTVMWLERENKPRRVMVRKKLAGQPVNELAECNRTLQLHKTRNGKGAGSEIAMTFSSESLTFIEHGAIVNDVE